MTKRILSKNNILQIEEFIVERVVYFLDSRRSCFESSKKRKFVKNGHK